MLLLSLCRRALLIALLSLSNIYPAFPFATSPTTPAFARGGAASPSDDTLKTADILSLDSIRASLIRQEETIIFALIERAQFRTNAKIYERNSEISFEGEGESFLEHMILGTEKLHASVRRFTSPEEHAFFPEAIRGEGGPLKPLIFPSLLSGQTRSDNLNLNPLLLRSYIARICDRITIPGDDEQYGSSVLADINALQAISRRVHYGKFVAESKFRSDEATYRGLVAKGDADGVMELLTNEAVEEKVLARAGIKAKTYGRDPGDKTENVNAKVKPEEIVAFYRDLVIPLTKLIEVEYLFLRCGREPPERGDWL